MNKSIFPNPSMDRSKVHWEDFLYVPTPIEFHTDEKTGQSCWFKREDTFAPLGYGGINGSKLRQAIYLGSKHMSDPNVEYLVGGMSTHSPQLPMQTAVARHFGKQAITITPGKRLELTMEHEMPNLAAWFGAKFVLARCGYNAFIQFTARDLQRMLGGPEKCFYLEYAITLDIKEHSPQELYDFHSVGAEQVKNIPDNIEELIIPMGSANSTTGIFLGLCKYPKPNLKKIHLITTGPCKIDNLTKRLELMRQVAGIETRRFNGLPYSKADLMNPPIQEPFLYDIKLWDQHAEGFSVYADLMPYTFDDMELHPTYEGKIMNYIQKHCPELIHPKALFWIVGSYPYRKNMEPYFEGSDPKDAQLWEFADGTTEIIHEEEPKSTNKSVTKQPMNKKEPFVPEEIKSWCELNGCEDVRELTPDMDFRDPRYRREVFTRFYAFHTSLGIHPGLVYLYLPEMAKRQGWDMEQRCWAAFLEGCCENPCTVWQIMHYFPRLPRTDEEFKKFEDWHADNWHSLLYDTDTRYNKGHLPKQVRSYLNHIGVRTQEQYLLSFKPADGNKKVWFDNLWKEATDWYKFGRLTTWSGLEFFRILTGYDYEYSSFMMTEIDGSKSHRNGMLKVLGRDDLVWDERQGNGVTGHTKAFAAGVEIKAQELLQELRERFKNEPWAKYIGAETIESALCAYKNFHFSRRYPNIYSDLSFDRIKKAEAADPNVDFSIFWDMRAKMLPHELLLEFTPLDPGLKPEKQEYFAKTGKLPMIGFFDPVFKCDWDEKDVVSE